MNIYLILLIKNCVLEIKLVRVVFLLFKRTFACPEHRSDCKPGGCYAVCPDVLHLNKAHDLHQPDNIPNWDRSSNSVRPSLKTVNRPSRGDPTSRRYLQTENGRWGLRTRYISQKLLSFNGERFSTPLETTTLKVLSS